jgi:hypothetical protein
MIGRFEFRYVSANRIYRPGWRGVSSAGLQASARPTGRSDGWVPGDSILYSDVREHKTSASILRLNAQKSTGPRTEHGGLKSRLTAARHGLAAENVVHALKSGAD